MIELETDKIDYFKQRLTDRKVANNLKQLYEILLSVGQPRDISYERYIKLAEYENKEDDCYKEKNN